MAQRRTTLDSHRNIRRVVNRSEPQPRTSLRDPDPPIPQDTTQHLVTHLVVDLETLAQNLQFDVRAVDVAQTSQRITSTMKQGENGLAFRLHLHGNAGLQTVVGRAIDREELPELIRHHLTVLPTAEHPEEEVVVVPRGGQS